jgi:ferredoxin
MPKITVKDGPTFEVEKGVRLILALKDSGVDILHRCGGNARCTTCRVEFHEGEPVQMTKAEYERLSAGDDLLGKVRLSCQIPCQHDMTVTPLKSMANTGLDDPGSRPADEITPEPEWMEARTS